MSLVSACACIFVYARDLGQLAHLIASTDDLALIPKTIIVLTQWGLTRLYQVNWEWNAARIQGIAGEWEWVQSRVGLSAHVQ